jgi:hypothetical protein
VAKIRNTFFRNSSEVTGHPVESRRRIMAP